MITFQVSDLQQCIPTNTNVAAWYTSLMNILPQYQINTINRVAAFIAQCAIESADFTTLTENLMYSAAGLLRVWPSHFTQATATQYAYQPQQIANIAYANRMGNGDVSSGDGWNFRGRGLIQVTGRTNYSACSTYIYGDDTMVQNPDLLTTSDGAVQSAVWFWNADNLNALADTNQITNMTIKINGSAASAPQRVARYNLCWTVLNNANNAGSTP